MTHTNHALHLNAHAGNWSIDQDGTLTIKGRDDRDLNRAICIMAEPEGYVGCYRLDVEGDNLYACCYDTGSPLPALCEIECEELDDGVDVSSWHPCSEGVYDSGKVTYTVALDALRSALNITAAHALSIVDTACENEPTGLGEYYTITGHRFIQLRPHEWIPVPCPAGSTTWDWADVKAELDGFPLIASTNPLAELPSDKIKALEAALEALRTLRLSGVDWQRLAAEE